MKIGWEQYVQAIIALFVIATPPDPVKILIFNDTVKRQKLNRVGAALKLALLFLGIMGVVALVGRELLDLFGINLHAFSAVGGLVLAAMGFEMLYGGEPSLAQGRQDYDAGPSDEDGLIMPLGTPLLAGPGAIATVVALASTNDSWDATIMALVAVGVVSLVIFLSMSVLGTLIGKASAKATQLLQRIGGLLLATIGVQMMLNGLKTFFS